VMGSLIVAISRLTGLFLFTVYLTFMPIAGRFKNKRFTFYHLKMTLNETRPASRAAL
jgi:hypothetical protein